MLLAHGGSILDNPIKLKLVWSANQKNCKDENIALPCKGIQTSFVQANCNLHDSFFPSNSKANWAMEQPSHGALCLPPPTLTSLYSLCCVVGGSTQRVLCLFFVFEGHLKREGSYSKKLLATLRAKWSEQGNAKLGVHNKFRLGFAKRSHNREIPGLADL